MYNYSIKYQVKEFIMKIKSIRAVSADFLRPPVLDESVSKKSRPSWASSGPVANPMTRYG